MILKHIHIEKFRKLQNIEFDFGSKVTAIVGQNGTMKTTILGLIGNSFSLKGSEKETFSNIKTIDNYLFESKFMDKFKISLDYEQAGNHTWSIEVPPEIHEDQQLTYISINRKEKDRSEKIRFWTTKGRKSGDGFIQCPVIYLSLARLSPIGETKSLKTTSNILLPEELDLFKEYYSKILLLSEDLNDVDLLKGTGKTTLGAKNSSYDSLTISAGQDNVGKILMAIFSFKRAKDALGNKYKGGILLIDEIDATLFPAAQEKLVECLFKFSRDYKIQIIFTTHSHNIIKTLKQCKYKKDSKLIYLKNVGDNVIINEDASLEAIDADLQVRVLPSKNLEKMKVYTEDNEAMIFLKRLLERKVNSQLLTYMDGITLGCKNYKDLIRKSVPEFKNSIIVLDGDETSTSKNLVILPGNNQSPEQLIYSYLKSLDPQHLFWDNSLGGYNSQVCFKDYPNPPRNRDEYKVWFKSQEQYWGKGCAKLFNQWKKDNPAQVSEFISDFKKAYNLLAKQKKLPPI